MPITQTRMMALIGAARAYQAALDHACAYVQEQLRLAHQGRQTYQEAGTNISYTMTKPALMNNPLLHDAVIFEEARHFERMAGHNERDRMRQEAKRGVRRGKPRKPKHTKQQILGEHEFRETVPERLTTAPKDLRPQSKPRIGALAGALAGMAVHTPDDDQEEDFENGLELSTDLSKVDLTRDVTETMSEEERVALEKEIELALAQTEVLDRDGRLGVPPAAAATPDVVLGDGEGDPK